MTFEEKTQALKALLNNNTEAAEKFKAIGADKEAFFALAKEYGIEFTCADLENKAELSDDELKAVVGGSEEESTFKRFLNGFLCGFIAGMAVFNTNCEDDDDDGDYKNQM